MSTETPTAQTPVDNPGQEQGQPPAPIPMARTCPFDPPEVYRRLRTEDPIHRILLPSGDHAWLVTRLADIRAILSDPRFSHRNDLIEPPVPPEPIAPWVPTPPTPGGFNMMDPPDHTRYRKILARYFTARHVARFTARITEIANELIDQLAASGTEADLVADYAAPLAGRAIFELVGVDDGERADLQRNIDTTFCLTVTLERAIPAITNLGAAIERIVAGRLAEVERSGGAGGRDDVLTDLIVRDELDGDELRTVIFILLVGGMDTTANMLALGTLALLRHPDQLALFTAGSQPGHVDELLRWLTISQWGASRRALADVTVGAEPDGSGGHLVREGEMVVLALNSANRDPAAFPEPDRLDLGRRPSKHVAFGGGVHMCIGQHLARATLRAGWDALFSRLPDIRTAPGTAEPRFRLEMTHYGLCALPVTWGPET
jgi:cytochrome P450